jgi:hypothetical protein
MIKKLGTIITTCFFMPSIIPSIWPGSVNGFTGATGPSLSSLITSPLLSSLGGFLRYLPEAKEEERWEEREW